RVMDARSMTFPDATFDLVLCHALLHHVDARDRVKVVREMARVSKRYVVYIEPNILNPIIAGFSTVKREERGALRFTPYYVRSFTKEANLRIIASCSWGLLTPNRMPFATTLSSFFRLFERPFPLGVTTIVIAEKSAH
ncbi:class I SAM-dependent methyltransferase, partial [Candidatus Peregrinibacteria bacterium]|nr:class I SAM-dependent methyltransferase [Candidatus Peregrinibacteria bacterium]